MPDPGDEQATFCLDDARFPVLAELRAQGGAAAGELDQLLKELRPPRSLRQVTRVLGKLLRRYKGEEVVESVVVKEISETGAIIRVPRELNLSLSEAAHVRIWLCAEPDGGEVPAQEKDREQLEFQATLVRMISSGDFGADLAFRFESVAPEARGLLYRLRHWPPR